MRLIRFFTSALVIILLSTTVVVAQKNYSAEADKHFELRKYYEAIDLYKKAYSQTRNKPEKRRILYQIAECYLQSNDLRRAERQYDKAINAGFPLPIVYMKYAKVLKMLGKYEEAKLAYEKYMEKEPGDRRGQIGYDYCDSALAWIDNPTRWEVEPMKRQNSRENDFAPSYAETKNYSVVVFTSSSTDATGRKYDEWTGQSFTDLFYITKDKKDNWSRPQLFDEDKIINTEHNEGTSTFNKKANTIYFSRCLKVKKEKLGCDIYFSKKRGRSWGEPEALNIAADSLKVVQPSISEDEKTMYFVSDMPGGYGGADIWMVRRTSSSKPFGAPENLGPIINTTGNEMFPYLREDGVLYFSSDGHPGMGGLDIFRSTMINGRWTEPENMKYPINSPGDDFGIILEGGEKAYGQEENGFMTSSRDVRGTRGGDDLFQIHLPPILFTLTGVVRDNQTLQRIPGAKVVIKGSDGTVKETVTDEKGIYRFNNEQILPRTTYDMEVTKDPPKKTDKPIYFGETGKETTIGYRESTDLVHDFKLEPIPADPIVLPEIRYELAKWDLQDEFKDSLSDVVEIMNQHPNIVVELISHTDFRASHEFNDTLSFKRSRSCVEYLIKEKGIDPDRLIPVGRGEREPRKLKKTITYDGVTFKTGTHLTEDYINGLRTTREKEAAHQLNRRTEFRIVRSDYVPKDANVKLDTAFDVAGLIQVNPDQMVVNFYVGENGEIKGTAYANELTVEFEYNEPLQGVSMSYDQAMYMLRRKWITKNNFTEGDQAILEDGSIKDGAEFVLNSLEFGRNMVLRSVNVTVSYDQASPIMIGEEGLSKIGKFTVDRNKSQIIFETAEY